MARGQDVLHQEGATGPKRARDRAQDDVRMSLIVDRIESGDQVELVSVANHGHIASFEPRVRQSATICFGSRGGDCILAMIEPNKSAFRELNGEAANGPA